MSQRVSYRRRHAYATKSNKVRVVKTPGNKLVVHYRTKKAAAPKCGDCGATLPGLPALRPTEYARLPRHEKTVTRAYGASRCAKCVRMRIVRAFLIEEQKIVAQMNKAKAAADAKTAKL